MICGTLSTAVFCIPPNSIRKPRETIGSSLRVLSARPPPGRLTIAAAARRSRCNRNGAIHTGSPQRLRCGRRSSGRSRRDVRGPHATILGRPQCASIVTPASTHAEAVLDQGGRDGRDISQPLAPRLNVAGGSRTGTITLPQVTSPKPSTIGDIPKSIKPSRGVGQLLYAPPRAIQINVERPNLGAIILEISSNRPDWVGVFVTSLMRQMEHVFAAGPWDAI